MSKYKLKEKASIGTWCVVYCVLCDVVKYGIGLFLYFYVTCDDHCPSGWICLPSSQGLDMCVCACVCGCL